MKKGRGRTHFRTFVLWPKEEEGRGYGPEMSPKLRHLPDQTYRASRFSISEIKITGPCRISKGKSDQFVNPTAHNKEVRGGIIPNIK